MITYDDFPSDIHPTSWIHQIYIISLTRSDYLTTITLPLNITDPNYFLHHISRWSWGIAEAVLSDLQDLEAIELLSENPRGSEDRQDVPYGRSPLPLEIQEAFVSIFPLLSREGLLYFD